MKMGLHNGEDRIIFRHFQLHQLKQHSTKTQHENWCSHLRG
jgi:hypothetical protein